MLKKSDQVRESENLSEPKFVPLEVQQFTCVIRTLAWLLNVNWDTSLKKILKEGEGSWTNQLYKTLHFLWSNIQTFIYHAQFPSFINIINNLKNYIADAFSRFRLKAIRM